MISGSLSIFDYAFLKGMWEIPAARHYIKKGAVDVNQVESDSINRAEKRRANKTSTKNNDPDPMDFAFDLIKLLPHSIIASLQFEDSTFWCNLDSKWLVGQSSDIMMKHGVAIPGEWHMVGILEH